MGGKSKMKRIYVCASGHVRNLKKSYKVTNPGNIQSRAFINIDNTHIFGGRLAYPYRMVVTKSSRLAVDEAKVFPESKNQ